MILTVLAGHPYLQFSKPSVWQMGNGQWTVRWRDFLTVKQDAYFPDRESAESFAATVGKPPIVVDGDPEDISDADRFWRELAEEKPR